MYTVAYREKELELPESSSPWGKGLSGLRPKEEGKLAAPRVTEEFTYS